MYLSSPHMGGDEAKLVQEAFATNWIAPLGPHVDKFEAEFVGLLTTNLELSVTGSQLLEAAAPGAAAPQLSVNSSQLLGQTNNQEQITNNRREAPALYAAALSSGTAAIHLALRMLGVGQGDEVFVSSLTFSATVNPICYEKARPVFIDSERESWNMDPNRLAEALEDRARKGKPPKAVIVVHLYGQCANLDPIVALCAKHNVPLIEDAAEALGAVYYSASPKLSVISSQLSGEAAKPQLSVNSSQLLGQTNNQEPITNNSTPISPGTLGRLGIFSFNGNKIITTSGGGMLVSHDEALIKKARYLATQARDPAPHYQHSEIGFNYRLSNVLAAIGRGQLRVLNERVEARRANLAFYQKAFANVPGVEFMPEAPWNRCTRWLTCILVDPHQFGADRETIRLALEAENIESRPVWKPMHLQPVFAVYDRFGGEVAEDLFDRGLCLPSGSNLSEPDLQRVVDIVRRCRDS